MSQEHVYVKRDGKGQWMTRHCERYLKYAVRAHSGWLTFVYLEDARAAAREFNSPGIWERDEAFADPVRLIEKLPPTS